MALIWPFTLKTREERWTVLILSVFLVCTTAPLLGYLPHYSAPIMALLYLWLLQGFSRLRGWSQGGRPLGKLLLAGLIQHIEKTPGNHLVLCATSPTIGSTTNGFIVAPTSTIHRLFGLVK